MSDPTTPAEQASPAEQWLARLRLSEPVRLYLYSLLLVAVAALTLAGWMTGDWAAFLIADGATVLAVPAATEAARASTWSPATVAVVTGSPITLPQYVTGTDRYQEALARFQAMANDGADPAAQQ